MKKQLLLISLLMVLFSVSAFAQRGERTDKEPRTPEERATAQTNSLEKKLNLTADQKAKIYEINLTAAKKNDELRAQRQSQTGEREDIKNTRIENEKNRDASIQALLDEDQKVKYAEMKAAQKERMQERRENKGKGGLRGRKGISDTDNDDDGN